MSKDANVEMHPFSEEEWLCRGKKVPKTNKTNRMSILGTGAFMTTYRMRNTAGDVFAVKVVQTDDMENLGITLEDVEREAGILGMLKYKHVVKYIRLYQSEDELGLVMEWDQGGSLVDFIKARQTVGIPELIGITSQLASALDYCHRQGIVHKDLKLDNALLTNTTGQVCVKLTDFGLTAVMAGSNAGSNLKSKVNTDAYSAPERARGKDYGFKADMWSLDCVVIELIRCQRIEGPLWDVSTEIEDQRNQCFDDVQKRNVSLADIVRGLLRRYRCQRTSVVNLKVCLSNLKEQERSTQVKNALNSRPAGKINDDVPGSTVKKQKTQTEPQQQGATHSSAVAFRQQFAGLQDKVEMNVIVKGMHTYSQDADVQEQACLALRRLAQNKVNNRVQIAGVGGIKRVVAAIAAHLMRAGVQEQACGALANFAIDIAENQTAIVTAGGIPVVLAEMKAHVGLNAVQWPGLRMLAHLAMNVDNQTAIIAARGIPAVLEAMSAHAEHRDVQGRGLLTLENLLVMNLIIQDETATAIAAAGGIPIVLTAMKTLKRIVDLQEKGILLLCDLAVNHDKQIAMAAAGGIPEGLAAMKAHTRQAEVQRQGFRVLARFFANGDNLTAIAATGGIPVVLAAMTARAGLVDMLELGLEVLGNLAILTLRLQGAYPWCLQR